MAGNAAFFLAMQGQVLTRTFLAWELTQEEMSLAYINIAFAIPMLIFSLLGGAMSDRIERRKLIVHGITDCGHVGILEFINRRYDRGLYYAVYYAGTYRLSV